MIRQISERLLHRLIRNHVIDQDDWEIYEVGLEQIIISLINALTMLVIAVIFGEVWQCILFAASFIAIRVNAGGYHARTPLHCYILTVSMFIVALAVMKFVVISQYVFVMLLVFASMLIWILCPVDTENKPMDEIEKQIFRQRAMIAWLIETLIAIAFLIFGLTAISECIILAQVLIGVSLLLGSVSMKKCVNE